MVNVTIYSIHGSYGYKWWIFHWHVWLQESNSAQTYGLKLRLQLRSCSSRYFFFGLPVVRKSYFSQLPIAFTIHSWYLWASINIYIVHYIVVSQHWGSLRETMGKMGKMANFRYGPPSYIMYLAIATLISSRWYMIYVGHIPVLFYYLMSHDKPWITLHHHFWMVKIPMNAG
jgi:hypothetical protein